MMVRIGWCEWRQRKMTLRDDFELESTELVDKVNVGRWSRKEGQ